jgi:multidrug efflux pump subunit AcrA (membrane-fusion protein)
MGKRLSILFILILIAAGAVFYLWRPWEGASKESPKTLATVRAERRDIVSTVLATGKILPMVGAEVNVGSRISGRLERLYVNVGDHVKKDQVIAEIEKQDLEAARAENEAEVALIRAKISAMNEEGPREIDRAKARLSEREAGLKFSKTELKRMDQLQGIGAIGKKERDLAVMEFEVATSQVEVAKREVQLAETRFTEGLKQLEAELAKAQASLKNAMVQLSYAEIKAPMSGVVASVSTREGETVAAGLNAPTFVTIIDLERLQLDAYVDEVDIGRIRVGQKVIFSVDAYTDREFRGEVTAIYPRPLIQENVITYDCIVSIDTPYEGILRPEMTATVTILCENREDVLVLPVQAVKKRVGKSIVYRKTGDRVEEISVATGWRDESLIEVTSGLREGDEVLLALPD